MKTHYKCVLNLKNCVYDIILYPFRALILLPLSGGYKCSPQATNNFDCLYSLLIFTVKKSMFHNEIMGLILGINSINSWLWL